jgi:UDP-GlcNAc:undecaprenyl-phosphate GlcNAc-1-phosphate transferase
MTFSTTQFLLILLVLIISILTAIAINQYLLSTTLGLYNKKDEIVQERWAAKPKPTIGGLSFFINFVLLSCCIFCFSPNNVPYSLILSLTIAAGFGYLDDCFQSLPFTKLIGQFIVSWVFLGSGFCINISDYDLLDSLFTVIWVVGIMNSINMLDNMDGVVASVSIISLGIALIIIADVRKVDLTNVLLIVGVIGSLVAFLFFNWKPAKIYMGDTGSQFLGAFLAWVGIQYFWIFRDGTTTGFQAHQFLVPALAFTVSLIDTTTVTIQRLARGVSPFVGGRDHTTHHLAYLGISDKNVVRILIGISLVSTFVVFLILEDLKYNHWNFYKTLAIIFYYVIIFSVIQYYYEVAKRKMLQRSISKQNVLTIEKLDEVSN